MGRCRRWRARCRGRRPQGPRGSGARPRPGRRSFVVRTPRRVASVALVGVEIQDAALIGRGGPLRGRLEDGGRGGPAPDPLLFPRARGPSLGGRSGSADV